MAATTNAATTAYSDNSRPDSSLMKFLNVFIGGSTPILMLWIKFYALPEREKHRVSCFPVIATQMSYSGRDHRKARGCLATFDRIRQSLDTGGNLGAQSCKR